MLLLELPVRAEALLPEGRLTETPVRPLVPAVGLLLVLGRLTLPLLLVRPVLVLPTVGRLDMLPVGLTLVPPIRPDMLPAVLEPVRPSPCRRWPIEPAVPLP